MAALTRRQEVALAAFFIAYACIAVPLGVHRGGDVVGEMALAERLLHGQVFYDVPPGEGTWWPPLAVALVSPFALVARLSLPLAKACWGLFGMGCLAWGVRQAARRWGFGAAVGALAVALFPIHNNFHHTNIEAPLVALLVAAAAALSDGRDTRVGIWVGLATALKVIPGLLIPYLVVRRRWRAASVATGVALVTSLGTVLPLGFHGALETLRDWANLSAQGHNRQGAAVAGLHMQKLGRLGYALGGAPTSIVALHLLALGLLAAILLARPADDDAPLEVGSVMLVAVLVTPIAWLHTFSLGYLAWVAAFAYVPPLVGRARTAWRVSLVAGAIYASTAVTALHLPGALQVLTFYNDTIGALVALALLAWQRHARTRGAVPPLVGSPQPV
jgi:alpha-1,2-mannosyltransferase